MNNFFGKIITSKFGWLWLLLTLVAINIAASFVHSRIDLTKEKRYTLSKATRNLLLALDDDVQIDVFLKGEFPAKFRKLTNSVGEFLQLLEESSNSRLNYKFISPLDAVPGTDGIKYADTLKNMGALPINLKAQVQTGESSSFAFPFAIMRYKGRQELITIFTVPPLFSSSNESPEKIINNTEALLEYQFAKALNGLVTPEKPFIAYSFGNGEPTDARTYGLQQALQTDYRLAILNINEQPLNPDTFKVLIIVKPSLQFSDNEKLKIDQYVMGGGKLLLFIDDLIAEQDSLRYKPEIIAYDRNLNLTDLLFRYGVRVNPSLVMDLQCDFLPFAVGGSGENPQFEFLHWNYYPLFEGKTNHTINKNLGLVAGRFVNSIDTIKTPGVAKTILLSSSPNSRVVSTPALISLNENRNVPQDEKFNQSDIPVAVLLEGKFTSLYRNRISQQQKDTLQATGISFKDFSDENKIIVVGDGDISLNDVSAKDGPLPMGVNLFTAGSQYEYQFANREFLLNCMEYLVSNPAIIETRNKNIVLRLLDTQKVQESKTLWQFINIGVPVLFVILAGFIYQQIRKRKYAS